MANETKKMPDLLFAMLVGTGVGAALGASAAALLQPRTGKENRERFANKAEHAASKLKEKYEKLHDKLVHGAAETKALLENLDE